MFFLLYYALELMGIGSATATYPQFHLLSYLWNNEVQVAREDFIHFNLMLVASVILLIANDGEISFIVNFD